MTAYQEESLPMAELKPPYFPQATVLRAERFALYHQQIDIQISTGLVTSSWPEKYYLLRMPDQQSRLCQKP
jgi:hypothetical protein